MLGVLVWQVQSLGYKSWTQRLLTSVSFSRGPMVWCMLGHLQRGTFYLYTEKGLNSPVSKMTRPASFFHWSFRSWHSGHVKGLAMLSGMGAIHRPGSTGSKAGLAVAAANRNLRRVPSVAPPIKGWPLDAFGKASDSSLLESEIGFLFTSYGVWSSIISWECIVFGSRTGWRRKRP